jgi:hypothetical protein
VVGEPSHLPGRGQGRMFHMTCGHCHHAVLAMVMESSHGISSIGLVTDLEAQDAVRIHDAKPICANDVIRAHAVLNAESQALCREWLLDV